MSDRLLIGCRIQPSDGEIRWIQAIGSAFYNEKSNVPISMGGIVLDITERKLQEEKLLASNEQLASRAEQDRADLGDAQEALENTNLEMQQFAYVAAHDMQTPLRSITGFAQLLQKEYRGRQSEEPGCRDRESLWLGQDIGIVASP